MEEDENIPGVHKVLVAPVAAKEAEKRGGEILLEGRLLAELAAGKEVEKGDVEIPGAHKALAEPAAGKEAEKEDGEILLVGRLLAEPAAEQGDEVMSKERVSVAGRVVVVVDEATLLKDIVLAEGDVEVEVR